MYPQQVLSIILDGTSQAAWCLPHFAQPTKATSALKKNITHITGKTFIYLSFIIVIVFFFQEF
jgi:hypothetical protein